MARASALLALLGLVVAALTAAALATTRPWPAQLDLHLTLLVAAGAIWAITILALPRLARAPGQLAIIVTIALAIRVVAWRTPPAHSDDVYRYLWDGRVAAAGLDPYAGPPQAARFAPLRDSSFDRINHRELPTIYPPLAELAFRAAAMLPFSPLTSWKLVCALADLAVLGLLWAWLLRRAADPRLLILWAWSPLVVIELAENGHVDALGIALLVGALLAFETGRKGLAGALLGGAALVKLLPAALLPTLPSRRVALGFIVALALLFVPFARGARPMPSLGEYGRRWRANDGAFALFDAVATRAVTHSRFAKRADLPDHPRLARLVSGRDRNQLYPDEVANFAARVAAGLLFLAALGWAVARRLPPARAAEVVLGAFVLLTPALHPWYVLWLLPLAAVGGTRAWLALAALAPLAYVPLGGWLTHERWHDPVWTRLCEHGLTWLLLAAPAWRQVRGKPGSRKALE